MLTSIVNPRAKFVAKLSEIRRPSPRVALRVIIAMAGPLATAAFAPGSVAARLEEMSQATPLIIETARQLCVTVSNEGTLQGAKIQGEIKAGINGLFTKLVDVGMSGGGDWNTSRYQGVMQSDLATAFRDQDECRTRVFNQMLGLTLGVVEAPYIGYQPSGDIDTEIRYYLDISGGRAGMQSMIDSVRQSLEVSLRAEFPDNSAAVTAISTIINEEMPRFDEIIETIMPIYKRYITLAQIQEMNKFFSTPVMRDMARHMPAMMQEATPVIMQYSQKYTERIDMRVQQWAKSHQH